MLYSMFNLSDSTLSVAPLAPTEDIKKRPCWSGWILVFSRHYSYWRNECVRDFF